MSPLDWDAVVKTFVVCALLSMLILQGLAVYWSRR